MVDSAQVAEKNRPYAPPSSVTTVLERVRSRNLPDRIDLDYLRDAGIPEGNIHRALFALRFLGLVEGERPSAALRDIATSTDEEYRKTLETLVREAYKDAFEVVDPKLDTPERIVDVFRRYTPASQRKRMVIFFLGMCAEAGIPVMEVGRKPRSAASTGTRTAKPKASSQNGKRQAAPKNSADGYHAPVNGSASVGSTGMPPALEGLIRSLPAQGDPFSKMQKELWLQMAKLALDYLYPEGLSQANRPVPDDVDQNTS